MAEELIREIMKKIEEKAFLPNAWYGTSNDEVVYLKDVIGILNEYKKKKSYWW